MNPTEPDAYDKQGRNPLMVYGLTASMNRTLIEAGARLDAVDDLGFGVLYHQCISPGIGYIKPNLVALQVLLDAGVPRPNVHQIAEWKAEVRSMVTSALENNEATEFCRWLDEIAGK